MGAWLRDAWYVAAFANEVPMGAPLARQVLDTQVVIFRSANGGVAALHDRCPHRFAPLSMGKVQGDRIVCGYHGLGFDAQGRCGDARLNSALHARAEVQSFPLVERHQLLWIWMGEKDKADVAKIPDFAFLEAPGTVNVQGLTLVKAHYLLEVDNLLDLSHIDHLHGDTISGQAMKDARRTLRQVGQTVHFETLCESVPCLPNFEPAVQAKGRPTDHWLDLRWDPAGSIRLDVGVGLAGRPKAEGCTIPQGHFMTPESERSTHYFWIINRPDQGEPPEYGAFIRETARRAFEDEDRPMIEAVQSRMRGTDFWAESPLIIPGDEGAVRARQVLQAALDEERVG